MKTLHIASGECVAEDLKSKGFNNVYAFNEAMCEGETSADILGAEFSEKRKTAYGITEYTHFADTLNKMSAETDKIELYFDSDMFCAANTVTLLSYLEKINYDGEINFNLVEQNGTADIIRSFPVRLGAFYNAYIKILVDRKPYATGVEHLDKALPLYLEYKNPENEITRFIKANESKERGELCIEVLKKFPEYGIGDVSIYKMIDKIKNSSII